MPGYSAGMRRRKHRQLRVIQPNQQAIPAAIDHRVPRPIVRMDAHSLATGRACNEPGQFFAIHAPLRRNRPPRPPTPEAYDLVELPRSHQDAPARRTMRHRLILHRSSDQWRRTHRTGVLHRCVQAAYAIVARRRKPQRRAVLAAQMRLSVYHRQRRSAIDAVRRHSAFNLARSGIARYQTNRSELIEHDVDRHARHGDIHPNRPSPLCNAAMPAEISAPGPVQRNPRKHGNGCG